MTMIIDNHIHLLSGSEGKTYMPPNYSWAICVNWAYGARQSTPYTRDPLDFYSRQEERVSDPDGSATIEAMDAAGVDAGVLIHADFGPSHGGGETMTMEEMAKSYTDLQNKHKGRLYSFAAPDVRRAGSLQLVEKTFRDWDTKGLKVFPEVGYFVNDPMLYPFYKMCLEYDKPVAICTNFERPFARARFNDPIYVSDVVADFPDLPVIMFHVGSPMEHWYDICMAIGRSALNTYAEVDSWMLGFNGAPQSISDEDSILRLSKIRDMFGAHRVIFGSDGQFAPGSFGQRNRENYIKRVQFWKDLPKNAPKYGVNFSQEEVDLMMGLNLGRLMGLIDMPEYDKKRKYGWSILMPRPNPTP
jgi:predicted TIM-barrel fold metal-dependent hydrolase